MKLSELGENYYPDFSSATTVEEILISSIPMLLNSQKEQLKNNPNQTKVITNFNVNEDLEVISASVENIYGVSSAEFKVSTPWEVSFQAGLKDWPFNATNLFQTIVDCMIFLTQKQSLEQDYCNYSIESGDGGIGQFSAEIEIPLKWVDAGNFVYGSNTADNVIARDETV